MMMYRLATEAEQQANDPRLVVRPVVPIEACEHGGYTRHVVIRPDTDTRRMCPGEPCS